MTWLGRYLSSNIGQKQLMALTGLGLSLFLIVHLLGHFILVFQGSEAYNIYSHNMVNSAIVWPARIGLLGTFLAHVGLAIAVTRRNKAARKESYKRSLFRNGEGTIASKTMIYTGMGLFFWIIWHVLTFSAQVLHVEALPMVDAGGMQIRDLSAQVLQFFGNPLNLVLYILGSVFAGFHVYHGFGSAFQTLGFYHAHVTPFLKSFSKAFGIYVFLGYAGVAVFVYLKATAAI